MVTTCRYSSHKSPPHRSFTSKFITPTDTPIPKSRLRLKKDRQAVPSLSQTTTIPTSNEQPSQLEPPKLYPLASSAEYEALRRRIVVEAGKGEIKYDVDFRPFGTMKEMHDYFYSHAAYRVQVERIKAQGKKLDTKPKIRCPLLMYERKTGAIINCITTASRDQDLPRHFEIHTSRPKFACSYPLCEYRTRQMCNLNQHYAAKHDKKAWAQCEYCEESFVQLADRSRHYHQVHGLKSKRAPRGDAWIFAGEMKQAANRRVRGEKPARLIGARWNEAGQSKKHRDGDTVAPPYLRGRPVSSARNRYMYM